ncbi:MAG: UDP-2,3-diacylglucosamine diphosphatase, partial [Hydrogenophaga sp.]|nr:UDP-2,3-diacylglucosamine diphosphatase [Hydrogenophaga sp.]
MRGALDVLGGWALKSGPPSGLPQGGLWDSQDAGDDAHGDTHERARFRAVFISDLHLGTAGCQARP